MDIQKLLQQAQAMQKQLADMEDELNEKVYEGTSGGSNGVKVEINGGYEVQSITIGDDLMDLENKEMLQDMLLLAMNQALEEIAKDKEENLGSVTGGLNIPGM